MHEIEIERALRNDPGLTPRPGFTGRVMVSVRQAAGEREGLAVPWLPLVAGLAFCAAVTGAGLLAGPRPDLQTLSRSVAGSGLAASFPWLAAALLCGFLPAWWSFRLLARRS